MTSDSPIKRVLLCTLCASLLALSGCGVFGSSCEAPPPPEDTVTRPALHVPPGVPAPDTRNALRIPELPEPERPRRRKSDPCLEEPPLYSPGWRPDEAGAAPDTAAATGDAPTTEVSKKSKKKKKKRTEQAQ